MLVREVLRGVAEVFALEGTDLNDIHTAVTEACNNVVQHAYEGEEGPLDVVTEPAQGAVTSWFAIGARDPLARPHGQEAGPGIGLSAIHALTRRLDLQRPADGGTEVSMEFAAAGARPPHAASGGAGGAARHRIRRTPLDDRADPHARRSGVHRSAPSDVRVGGARPLLHRPTLRCSPSRRCPREQVAGSRACGCSPSSSRRCALELRIGPLERGRGGRLVAESSLEGLGSVIAKLVDRCEVESAGSHEVLVLRLSDERGSRVIPI